MSAEDYSCQDKIFPFPVSSTHCLQPKESPQKPLNYINACSDHPLQPNPQRLKMNKTLPCFMKEITLLD